MAMLDPAEKPRCLNCRFFSPALSVPGQPEAPATCRRNPPTVVLVPTPQGIQISSFSPPTHPLQWCGEWKEYQETIV